MADKNEMAMEDAAFRDYLKDCDEHSIQPDTASAFHFAWQAARALAQGEPGEAVATVRVEISNRGNRKVVTEWSDGLFSIPEGEHPLYLSPTASAPAAEREPPAWPITWEVSWGELDEDDECSPCGWRVHDRRGGRNDREWTLIATGSTPFEAIRAAHGIGTKEPTNG